MKALDEECLRIEEDLKKMETEVMSLEDKLLSFEKYAARYPIQQVELRLQKVHLQIALKVTEQYWKHGNQGSVCVMTAPDGTVAVKWFESEPAVDEVGKLWTGQIATLTSEQYFSFMKNLRQGLHEGNWEPAVKWLNIKAIRLRTGEYL